MTDQLYEYSGEIKSLQDSILLFIRISGSETWTTSERFVKYQGSGDILPVGLEIIHYDNNMEMYKMTGMK